MSYSGLWSSNISSLRKPPSEQTIELNYCHLNFYSLRQKDWKYIFLCYHSQKYQKLYELSFLKGLNNVILHFFWILYSYTNFSNSTKETERKNTIYKYLNPQKGGFFSLIFVRYSKIDFCFFFFRHYFLVFDLFFYTNIETMSIFYIIFMEIALVTYHLLSYYYYYWKKKSQNRNTDEWLDIIDLNVDTG